MEGDLNPAWPSFSCGSDRLRESRRGAHVVETPRGRPVIRRLHWSQGSWGRMQQCICQVHFPTALGTPFYLFIHVHFY